MTRAEFIQTYLSNSQRGPYRSPSSFSIEEWGIDFGGSYKLIALPCRCEEDGCHGWQMLPTDLGSIGWVVRRERAEDLVPAWLAEDEAYRTSYKGAQSLFGA